METYDLTDLTRLVRTKVVVCECGCWRWTGSCDTSGYAKFKLRGKTIQVHRYSYEHLVGEIPEGLTVDHLACTLHSCINPAHMQLVTGGENSRRANATRWHDVKFDSDGNQLEFIECVVCLEFKPQQGNLAATGEYFEKLTLP